MPYRDANSSVGNDPLKIGNKKKGSSASDAAVNMIYIKGGSFLMGTDTKLGFPADGEGPVRETSVRSFYIDQTAVTNAQFKQFVDDTLYKTEAERFGWSFVFYLFLPAKLKKKEFPSPPRTPWWKSVKGARWDQPEGVGSHIRNRMDRSEERRVGEEWRGRWGE